MKTPNKQAKLAKRYANALLKLEEIAKAPEILAQLNSVNEILNSSAELKGFLENRLIKKEDKKDVIKQVLQGVSQNITSLLCLLVDGDKFNYFGAILNEFEKLTNLKNNIVNVEIISAIDLDETEKDKIKTKLENKLSKQVNANYSIDEEIIAGLIIRIEDNVIDNSHRAKLNNLKKHLT